MWRYDKISKNKKKNSKPSQQELKLMIFLMAEIVNIWLTESNRGD